MVTSPHINGGAAQSTAGGVTRWFTLAIGGRSTSTSSEASVQSAIYTPLSLTYPRVRVTSNGANASTLSLRVNGADAQSISITSSGTGVFSSRVAETVVVNGDDVAWQIVRGATNSTSITLLAVNASRRDQAGILHRYRNPSSSFATTGLRYTPVVGTAAPTSATSVDTLAKMAGVMRNLDVSCTSNTRTVAHQASVVKNGTGGALTVSITASTTGNFTDLSNTISYTSTDLFCFLMDGNGSGSGNMSVQILAEFDAVGVSKTRVVNELSTSSLAFNVTTYGGIAGAGVNTTESTQQLPLGFPALVSELEITITANSLNAAATYRNRVATANGAMSVSITAATTGTFEDTTNSNTVTESQQLNVQVVTTGSTVGSLTIREASISVTDLSPVVLKNIFVPQAIKRAAVY